jgi:hypothetical protein
MPGGPGGPIPGGRGAPGGGGGAMPGAGGGPPPGPGGGPPAAGAISMPPQWGQATCCPAIEVSICSIPRQRGHAN